MGEVKMNTVQYLVHFQDVINEIDNNLEGIMHCVTNDSGISDKSRENFIDCLKSVADQVMYLNKAISLDYEQNYKNKE